MYSLKMKRIAILDQYSNSCRNRSFSADIVSLYTSTSNNYETKTSTTPQFRVSTHEKSRHFDARVFRGMGKLRYRRCEVRGGKLKGCGCEPYRGGGEAVVMRKS